MTQFATTERQVILPAQDSAARLADESKNNLRYIDHHNRAGAMSEPVTVTNNA